MNGWKAVYNSLSKHKAVKVGCFTLYFPFIYALNPQFSILPCSLLVSNVLEKLFVPVRLLIQVIIRSTSSLVVFVFISANRNIFWFCESPFSAISNWHSHETFVVYDVLCLSAFSCLLAIISHIHKNVRPTL